MEILKKCFGAALATIAFLIIAPIAWMLLLPCISIMFAIVETAFIIFIFYAIGSFFIFLVFSIFAKEIGKDKK